MRSSNRMALRASGAIACATMLVALASSCGTFDSADAQPGPAETGSPDTRVENDGTAPDATPPQDAGVDGASDSGSDADACTFCTGFDEAPYNKGWDTPGGSTEIDLGPSDAGPRSAPNTLRVRIAQNGNLGTGSARYLSKSFPATKRMSVSFYMRIVSPNTEASVLEVASVHCKSVWLYLDAIDHTLVAGYIPQDGGGLNNATQKQVDDSWHKFTTTIERITSPSTTSIKIEYSVDDVPYNTVTPAIAEPLDTCGFDLGATYTTGGPMDETTIDFDDVRVDVE